MRRFESPYMLNTNLIRGVSIYIYSPWVPGYSAFFWKYWNSSVKNSLLFFWHQTMWLSAIYPFSDLFRLEINDKVQEVRLVRKKWRLLQLNAILHLSPAIVILGLHCFQKNALPNISKHLQLLLMAGSQELCCILLQHFLSSKFKLCLSFLLLRQQLVLNQMQPHCFFLTNPHSIYITYLPSQLRRSQLSTMSPVLYWCILIPLQSRCSPLTNPFVNSFSTLL